MKNPLKSYYNRFISRINTEIVRTSVLSPAVKIELIKLFNQYRSMSTSGKPLPSVWDVGFRVYSQFDEDGIILFLLGIVGLGPRLFVDIGGGDGITGSNTANLAINFGFHGVFLEGNPKNVELGQSFYKTHPDTWAYPPKFCCEMIKRSNINQVIAAAGISGEVDVLSIDIDGNDYWVWDAIDVISPRIVVIETHVEFGFNSIVVPYDENYVYPGKHSNYHGASPVAMAKLAKKLGYRLVAANRYGFNTFYVRNDLAVGLLDEIQPEDVLRHPRNREVMQTFEEIKDYEYVHV